MIYNEEADMNQVGKQIILASSFVGSTRYFQQLYQDAMAIVREFGKPDLFITVTCNPKWPEILDELLPNQKSPDRPDLIARVFKLKLQAITHDLFMRGVLGKVIANVHVIEFQKRGLPHVHILIILASEDKLQTPKDFDLIVSAEIPDKEKQPNLYKTISRNMIHGPCGIHNPTSPCMINGKCSNIIQENLLQQPLQTKMDIQLIKEEMMEDLSKKEGYQLILTIDGLFLIIHILVKNMIVILM